MVAAMTRTAVADGALVLLAVSSIPRARDTGPVTPYRRRLGHREGRHFAQGHTAREKLPGLQPHRPAPETPPPDSCGL